jgi:CII-binding regulator of phage lambda lysogenization HflD
MLVMVDGGGSGSRYMLKQRTSVFGSMALVSKDRAGRGRQHGHRRSTLLLAVVSSSRLWRQARGRGKDVSVYHCGGDIGAR